MAHALCVWSVIRLDVTELWERVPFVPFPAKFQL